MMKLPLSEERKRRWAGGIAMFAGIIAVALMDAAAKIASDDVSFMQITWGRFTFHCLALMPFVLIQWRSSLAVLKFKHSWHWSLHILRGVFLSLASLSFFLSVTHNPIPDALAVFFVEPLVVILLAHYFLGEKSNARIWAAAIISLIGVCIILRPGGENDYHWTIFFSLAAAVFFGSYIVLARFATANTTAVMTSWLTAAFGLLPLIVLMFFFWEPIESLRVWRLLILVGILSGLGHTLIIIACRFLSAAHVAILHYSEVGVATIISWVLFRHFPDAWVWVGIGLVAMANLYALKIVAPKHE